MATSATNLVLLGSGHIEMFVVIVAGEKHA